MQELLFLNGEYLPLSEGKVSVEDRGFQFADGIYEVIRVYNGHPFQLGAHLKRLARSANALELNLTYPLSELEAISEELISHSGLTEGIIYMQVTRGTAPRKHAWDDGVSPTTIIYVREMMPCPQAHQEDGVQVITVRDERWGRCDIKSVSLLANVLAKQRAVCAGAFEAVFVSSEGIVREGSSSNVWGVRAGNIFTHPAGPHILSGIERAMVLDIAHGLGLEVKLEPTHRERFQGADEVFLTGTTVEVMPVTAIDGKPVGTGKVGACTQQLQQHLRRRIAEECKLLVAK